METVRSKDGTAIAYDKVGQGAPLILVDGALCYRESGPMRSLAAQLAPHFTVYFYDRRGRGDSGDTKPWAVEREIEDIEALIAAAGGFGVRLRAVVGRGALARSCEPRPFDPQARAGPGAVRRGQHISTDDGQGPAVFEGPGRRRPSRRRGEALPPTRRRAGRVHRPDAL